MVCRITCKRKGTIGLKCWIRIRAVGTVLSRYRGVTKAPKGWLVEMVILRIR